MDDLKTIKLLGAAGRKFVREIKLAVKSPAEAMRALMVLFPQFKAWILEQHDRGVAWRVVTDDPMGMDKDGLTQETGSHTIVFAPVLQGAGGSGFSIGKILFGIALIVVSTLPFVGAAVGLSMGLLGGSLILSGVADLITPTPQLTGPNASNYSSGTEASRSADLESNLFSRNQGTGGQGECVPLLYGQRRVSSPRVISFDLRNLPQERQITTTGTQGLLGYVNEVNL